VCSEAGDTGWKQGDELITESHSLHWKFAWELTRLLGKDLKQVNHATLLDCFRTQLGCDPTHQVCSMMKTNRTPR
jgi:hypothetical protein